MKHLSIIIKIVNLFIEFVRIAEIVSDDSLIEAFFIEKVASHINSRLAKQSLRLEELQPATRLPIEPNNKPVRIHIMNHLTN